MTRLEISTSPRSTWLWAADEATVARVRAVLGDAAHSAFRQGAVVPLVVDVDIGVDALEACEELARAGFTFAWHASVHPLNRDGWPAALPGMPAS